MKIDGLWVAQKLGEFCATIGCPRTKTTSRNCCEGCPISKLQTEVIYMPAFETNLPNDSCVEEIAQLLQELHDQHDVTNLKDVAIAIDALYHPDLCPKCGCNLAAWAYDHLGEHNHFEVKP